MCELIATFGWRRFSVLHANDAYATAYAEGLRTNSVSTGLTVVASASYEKDLSSTYEKAVTIIRDSGVNVFVCIAWDQDLIGLLKLASEQGILTTGYVWLGGDTLSVGAADYAGSFAVSRDAALQMLDGLLTFLPSARGTAGYARYTAELQKHNISECENDFFNVTDYPTIYSTDSPYDVGASAYDCVVAFAIAMARSEDPSDGDEVYASFKQLVFDGASGLVKFDPNTGDRSSDTAAYVAMNWQYSNGSVGLTLAASISITNGI